MLVTEETKDCSNRSLPGPSVIITILLIQSGGPTLGLCEVNPQPGLRQIISIVLFSTAVPTNEDSHWCEWSPDEAAVPAVSRIFVAVSSAVAALQFMGYTTDMIRTASYCSCLCSSLS